MNSHRFDARLIRRCVDFRIIQPGLPFQTAASLKFDGLRLDALVDGNFRDRKVAASLKLRARLGQSVNFGAVVILCNSPPASSQRQRAQLVKLVEDAGSRIRYVHMWMGSVRRWRSNCIRFPSFAEAMELIQEPPKPKRNQTKGAKVKQPPEMIRLSDIQCHERLGGLLNCYSRKAA